MQIVGNCYSQTPIYERTNRRTNVKQNPADYSFVQEAAIINLNSSQSASNQGISNIESKAATNQDVANSSSIWEELSQEYDIHNATFDELCTISRKLYDNKQISLGEYGLLTFDYDKLYSKLTHQAAQYSKKDWIAEFEKRAEQELKVGNMLGYNNRENIVNILKRLE